MRFAFRLLSRVAARIQLAAGRCRAHARARDDFVAGRLQCVAHDIRLKMHICQFFSVYFCVAR